MISVYGFGSDEVEMLEQIMSADFMGQLGWTGGGGGSAFCKDWRQYMENIGMYYTKLDDGFEQVEPAGRMSLRIIFPYLCR
jgi:hypothetical protein